eukprot:scaffold824_cov64-Phaeocystis_antarctica.AAC.5
MPHRQRFSSAGRAPLSSAAARAAQPASEIWSAATPHLSTAAAPRGQRYPHRRAGCRGDRETPARAAAARPARGPPAPRHRWRCCSDRASRAAAGRLGSGQRRAPRRLCRPHAYRQAGAMSRLAARPRPAPPPAAARRRGRLSAPGGTAPRALAAPSPACPASPARPR